MLQATVAPISGLMKVQMGHDHLEYLEYLEYGSASAPHPPRSPPPPLSPALTFSTESPPAPLEPLEVLLPPLFFTGASFWLLGGVVSVRSIIFGLFLAPGALEEDEEEEEEFSVFRFCVSMPPVKSWNLFVSPERELPAFFGPETTSCCPPPPSPPSKSLDNS